MLTILLLVVCADLLRLAYVVADVALGSFQPDCNLGDLHHAILLQNDCSRIQRVLGRYDLENGVQLVLNLNLAESRPILLLHRARARQATAYSAVSAKVPVRSTLKL